MFVRETVYNHDKFPRAITMYNQKVAPAPPPRKLQVHLSLVVLFFFGASPCKSQKHGLQLGGHGAKAKLIGSGFEDSNGAAYTPIDNLIEANESKS